jgi:hypothetical protein
VSDLDGCDLDFTENPTPDDEIDALVLFADVDTSDPDAVARRAQEWSDLRGA